MHPPPRSDRAEGRRTPLSLSGYIRLLDQNRLMGRYRRNHIVTRRYLDLFSEDGRVACCFVETGEVKIVGTGDVAVLSDFYVYRRRDGSRSTEFEEAFGPLETKSVPILRSASERWPLPDADRATISEYLAAQMVRGIAWRAFHDELRQGVLDSQRESLADELGPEAWAQFSDDILSDRRRARHMVRQVPLIGSLVSSMHWSLIDFGSDRLISSDHPVVAVGVSPGTTAAVPRFGLANVAEIRFPVTPRLALLLSWQDQPDSEVPARGFPREARAINHSVKAQAERQWFHRPGTRPSVASTGTGLLTDIFHPGYTPATISHCERRRMVVAALNEDVEAQGSRQTMTVVRTRTPSGAEIAGRP